MWSSTETNSLLAVRKINWNVQNDEGRDREELCVTMSCVLCVLLVAPLSKYSLELKGVEKTKK